MPGATRKYSAKDTAIWRGELLLKLSHSPEAMSIPQLQAGSFYLNGVTSQKLARILNECVDMGLVRKAKSKSSGLMMYKSVAVMREQGYDVDEKENDDGD